MFGKHEDDYYFKNQTATQIVKSMAKKIGLKVYKLENTNVVISYVLYKKGAPDKITVDVLARTWKGGGDKFWFRYDPVNDGILLKRRTVPEMIWAFKTGGNLISASRERSIEEMYNTVKLINRETGKTATKVNAKIKPCTVIPSITKKSATRIKTYLSWQNKSLSLYLRLLLL